MDQLMCASLFPRPLLVCSGHVDRMRYRNEVPVVLGTTLEAEEHKEKFPEKNM